jgi:hypothetical protein
MERETAPFPVNERQGCGGGGKEGDGGREGRDMGGEEKILDKDKWIQTKRRQ